MAEDKDKLDPADVGIMSDEDFLAMDTSVFDDAEEDTDDTDEDTDSDSEDQDQDTDTEDNSDEDEDEDTDEDSSDEAAADDKDDPDSEEQSDDKSGEDAESASADDEDTSKDEDNSGELTDAEYAAIGKQLMGEFKANGSMMKVKSVDDAMRLMQMGTNYHKKMTGLKPALKTLKLLENNDLLDEGKLNYLIDLHQKKPEAITKLLKESGVDPDDIDVEAESSYTPTSRTVSEAEVDLDEVLQDIEGTKSYNRTLQVIGTDWDETSRQAIAQQPQFIAAINAHMENGLFDQIVNALEYERSMGRLKGISDFEAYQQIGHHMHTNNLFVGVNGEQNVEDKDTANTQQTQNSNSNSTQERKSKKKAAGVSRRKKAPPEDNKKYDPLAMSDEEYAKINNISL